MASHAVIKHDVARRLRDAARTVVCAAGSLAVMIGLLGGLIGCARGGPRDGVSSSMNATSPEEQHASRRLMCIRLDVPALFREADGHAVGCFGLVFQVKDGFESREQSVQELLAGGKLEACFRSVREARELISSRFARTGDKVEYLTVRHEHDAVWSVREEPLPERDQIMGDAKVWVETEIGREDSGVGPSVRVVGLPPPLGDRGVAMVQKVMKGRALHWVPQRDRNASLSTSWGELIGWIGRVREVEDFAVWNDGGLDREWAELRRRVDLREKTPTFGW